MSQTQTITSELVELQPIDQDAVQSHQTQSSSSTEAQDTSYPTGVKLILLSISVLLSIFLAALDTTIIATAIPSITTQFGTISNVAWYGSAFSITNTSFQSAWGKAYQLYPLKPVLLFAIAVFETGNVLCATAQSSAMLIFGRLIAGLGSGGTMTGAFIIIALTSPPKYRPASMGIVSTTFGCASVAGPLVGGALTDHLGWRWCFWISIPLGALAAGMIAISLAQPPHHTPPEMLTQEKAKQMDLGGVLLLTTALVCFVMAMHYGGKREWGSASTISCLAAFAASGALFIFNEYKMGSKAMLPMQLFRRKRVVANFAFIFFLAGLFFPLLYILPIQFQSINSESASQSGVRLIPLVLGVSIFTLITNGLLTFLYNGYFNPHMTGGSILSVVGIATILSLGKHADSASWIGYEILVAAGVGLSLQTPMLANQAAVPASDISAVTSVTLFCENMGTTLFIAVSEAAFTNGLVQGLHEFANHVDPQAVIDAGATQLSQMFKGSDLGGIVKAYTKGCTTSYTINLACGVAAVLVSFVNSGPSGWRILRKRSSARA